MSQQELLSRVIDVLNAHRVEYMVTGSIVSSLQGEPRASHDVDFVVALSAETAPTIAREFPPPDYYVDEQSIREAIARRDMFNLLQVTTGDKVDFWMLTDDPFDQERFARRRELEAIGIRMFVSSPEDTILQKLRWADMSGGSEKQFTDALRVFEVQRPCIDLTYMNVWARRLGVENLWTKIQRDAEPV